MPSLLGLQEIFLLIMTIYYKFVLMMRLCLAKALHMFRPGDLIEYIVNWLERHPLTSMDGLWPVWSTFEPLKLADDH